MDTSLKKCQAAPWLHRPAASRFVVHHIQPQVAGGKSVPENQIVLCDNCHYTIHNLMYSMATGIPPKIKGTREQRKIAEQGYNACVISGTVHKIPNEG